MNRLDRKVALVTGASSGIGRAIALKLAEKSVDLIVVGRRKHNLEEVKKEAEKHGIKVVILMVDLSSDLELIYENVGKLDILVHAAGQIALIGSDSTPEDEIVVNLQAPINITDRLVKTLENSQGEIVFINSTAALQENNISNYADTKRKLKTYADELRDRVNNRGIRILSIFPGRTATQMQEQIIKSKGIVYDPKKLLQPEDIAEITVAALELPRTAEVTNIIIRPFNK